MSSRTRLANEAWEALLGAHAELMRRFAAAELWQEISMREYDVLYSLARAERPLSLVELNRHVLLSQPALSRMVERLADRGLIHRERSSDDGRSVRLSLSARGAELQRRVGLAHGREVGVALSDRLDRGELEDLARLCRRLSSEPARVAA
ncbi:MAG TPA: MarR family transcriptional regulator [Solirubrobacteraceae bacterium]|nr:MarR family transcriptional regulator [Solirubrobacteraceae bacterium]